jgi:hypothetical protein
MFLPYKFFFEKLEQKYFSGPQLLRIAKNSDQIKISNSLFGNTTGPEGMFGFRNFENQF